MSEWKECALGDLLEIKYGKDHKELSKGNIPCFGSGGIMRYVDDNLYEDESILIPRKGSLNNVLYQDKPFWTVDTMFWSIINKQKVLPKFLFYQLSLIDFTNLNVGSAVPSLTIPVITSIDISLPTLPEQKAIAGVLSSLDDKIDLLHRQNKTLEAMAETLFRQWFIEEAEDDWLNIKLGTFFPVCTGKKDANYSTEHGEYPFFTCSQNTLLAPNYSFDGKAILVAGNGDFNIKRYSGKFEAYQRTYVLIPYKEKYYNFLYTLMKINLVTITSGYRGSVIRFITKGMLTDYIVQFPSNNIDDKLEKLDSIYNCIDANIKSIDTLEKLKKSLLPKLMSGEVRVEF